MPWLEYELDNDVQKLMSDQYRIGGRCIATQQKNGIPRSASIELSSIESDQLFRTIPTEIKAGATSFDFQNNLQSPDISNNAPVNIHGLSSSPRADGLDQMAIVNIHQAPPSQVQNRPAIDEEPFTPPRVSRNRITIFDSLVGPDGQTTSPRPDDLDQSIVINVLQAPPQPNTPARVRRDQEAYSQRSNNLYSPHW